MSRYEPLRNRLLSLTVSSVRMKFSDIEEIIGRDLPASARKYPAWWANNDQGGKRHSKGWLHVGWRAEDLALEMEEVTFIKASMPEAPGRFTRPGSGRHFPPIGGWLGPMGCLRRTCSSSRMCQLRPEFTGSVSPAASSIGATSGKIANLKSRFGFYRRPGSRQATNVRLNRLMLDHLTEGGSIELDLITEIGGLVHRGPAKEANLTDKAVRRLFEQAAIVADDATEIESLNR